MRARALMLLGTSSHVGKSLLTAALCRIFADHGVRVAPFKSQNMSLNSAATPEGLEIGRAQALQAEAARVPSSVHMNPILLKPAGDLSSQVVVRGKVWGKLSASDYHQRRVEELMPIVSQSYDFLACRHDLVILEGAGSPAEINLKQHDIMNMRMAEVADARCLLIGDIDRGGVFASLYGTVQLLDPSEQARICGFVVNKFRGDRALLNPGIRMMEDRLRKPCVGIVPWMHDLVLEEEDSLGLPTIGDSPWPTLQSPDRLLRIAIVALPSFSNFTDFDSLRHEPSVHLRLCRTAQQIAGADVIILPGSKQTVDDLLWMHARSLDTAICNHAQSGLVVGLCGGMQMLGLSISDEKGIEHAGEVDALGLLPFHTRMNPQKITRQATGRLSSTTLFGHPIAVHCMVSGYEIHIGETIYQADAQPFSRLHDNQHDGCISPDTRIFGTYLHGIFDDDAFRHAFLRTARSFHSLNPAACLENWKQKREDSFNRLAQTVRQALDMEAIFAMAGVPYKENDLHETAEHRH